MLSFARTAHSGMDLKSLPIFLDFRKLSLRVAPYILSRDSFQKFLLVNAARSYDILLYSRKSLRNYENRSPPSREPMRLKSSHLIWRLPENITSHQKGSTESLLKRRGFRLEANQESARVKAETYGRLWVG